MENTIAHRLKVFRASTGLTQDAFGESCGISQRTYGNLESGKTKKVSADYLSRIELAYKDLSPKWLRQGVGEMLRHVQAADHRETTEPTSVLKRNREGEDGNYWEQIAIERGNTIELLKKLLSQQFPGLVESPGKLVNSEYAAAMLEPVGFRQAGRQLAPSMFVVRTGHKYEWVDAALGQPLTVAPAALKKTA